MTIKWPKKNWREQSEDVQPQWQDAIDRLRKHFQDRARRGGEQMAQWAEQIRMREAEKKKRRKDANRKG